MIAVIISCIFNLLCQEIFNFLPHITWEVIDMNCRFMRSWWRKNWIRTQTVYLDKNLNCIASIQYANRYICTHREMIFN